ncbi:hypothetical protein RF11_09893 [Thelohanellus kitauei]|uniref:Uncharacterized protein n=1 Tax=Thelohanellus kitauei TaxID=669202 RepID=A0A0C2IFE4_THEKT|nr:hypothetical protein RF11_09893 [Thelohanellus kitauei]
MEYVHGQGDIDYFYHYNLGILKIENSILTVKFGEDNKQWLEIKCKSVDQEDVIEFSDCIISTKRNENDQVIEESIGYKFKFNNKTKYEFRKHYIWLKQDDNSKKKLKIRVYELVITFQGYTKKYCFNKDELDPISDYFTSTTVVENFERYGGTLSDEIDPSVPIKPDQINDKKGFWTTKNIIATVVSSVAVIISVLIVAIIIRYRISRHSIEA